MNRTGKGDVACSFAREGHKVHFRVLTPPSAPRASPPISKPAALWRTRKPWPRTKVRAQPSSTIARTTRSRSMRSSGLRFSGKNLTFGILTRTCRHAEHTTFVSDPLRKFGSKFSMTGVDPKRTCKPTSRISELPENGYPRFRDILAYSTQNHV
jgi:hypothetical protein